jgi:hypothetical protein
MKYNLYKEEREKLMKLEEEMKSTKESKFYHEIELRQKENTLRKEKEVLDENIKNYKNEKGYVDANIKLLNTQLIKLTEEETKAQIDKENFDKERYLFFNLNFLVNNTHNLDNKIEEMSNKFGKCYLISKRPSFRKEETDLNIVPTGNISVLKQNNSSHNFNLSGKMLDENNINLSSKGILT